MYILKTMNYLPTFTGHFQYKTCLEQFAAKMLSNMPYKLTEEEMDISLIVINVNIVKCSNYKEIFPKKELTNEYSIPQRITRKMDATNKKTGNIHSSRA